jgi:hypothetical protein
MALTFQPDSLTFHHLLGALRTGALRLVDEDAQPVSLAGSYDTPVWAHLRDAVDGQVYVHALAGSRELQAPRYLTMLGLIEETV